MQQTPLFVIVNNHFDPTWRRCFDQRFENDGRIFASYADLEAAYLLENLRIAERNDEYRFEVESPIVLRKFLERYPGQIEQLRRLADEGRFMVSGTGDNIIDANMVHGESLVRNFVDGTLWTEKVLGRRPLAALRLDAFGNSAQLPQILTGCGFKAVEGLSYTLPTGTFWRGLDGTAIRTQIYPIVCCAGGTDKYAPCPDCNGRGCEACDGWGFDGSKRAELPTDFHRDQVGRHGGGILRAMPEELLPNPELVDWVKKQDKVEARFALLDDVLDIFIAAGGKLEPEKDDSFHESVEMNPNNSGCWVTRIKTKQTCRRQEYALLGAESLCALARLAGEPYPRTKLQGVWRDLFFTQFHDAITATHVDPAYEELQEYWQRIDDGVDFLQSKALRPFTKAAMNVVSVVNPTGDAMSEIATLHLTGRKSMKVEVLDKNGKAQDILDVRRTDEGIELDLLVSDIPAFSVREFTIRGAKKANPAAEILEQSVIENERYRVEADKNGLTRIFDKKRGGDICRSDEYRPAEFLLEHDEGSPWATLSEHRPRLSLVETTTLESVEKGRHFQRMVFTVGTPSRAGAASGQAVEGKLSVTLVENLDRVDFHFETYWTAFNTRLRVAFPVPRKGKHFYGIPYGMLERKPYEPSFSWTGANGDWPAIDWAGVQASGLSVALLNKGLPSYAIEPGDKCGEVIMLSLLRSPAGPTYLHEPQHYTMTDYDGMRDEGYHAFDFALVSFDNAFARNDVVARAASYNAGLLDVEGRVALPEAPRVEGEGVRLTALKGTESGGGLAARLVECRGRNNTVTLHLPEGMSKAEKTNLLEEKGEPLPVDKGSLEIELRPWEIATVVMKR